jgi:hypothetical protein
MPRPVERPPLGDVIRFDAPPYIEVLRLPCTYIRPAAVSLAAESPDKWFIFKRMNGAARGIRTPDLRIPKPFIALSQ